MKRLALLLTVSALFVWGQQHSPAGDKASLDNVEYCPLKVGTTWEYLVNGKKVTRPENEQPG